ncbi:MAG: glycerol-3-phosphate 1-O-acyltransferase PlsY [Clostridia bacterium]|nr:glycerol-3-phosphate 1-O-acyltransferase PlsY [Clostridia bacterium]
MLLKNLFVLLISYLLGSISTSIIISKIMLGDDIRNHGSGNAGATNTLRTIGKKAALFVVLGDVLKTVLAILAAKLLLKGDPTAVYIAGIGAVLGHNFPLYFKFKGGKGIVVSATSMIFADPAIGMTVAVVAILIMAVSRYVSLGSILGAVFFVVLSFLLRAENPDFIVFACMLALLAIYMHKSNIQRLLSGTESKLSFKK